MTESTYVRWEKLPKAGRKGVLSLGQIRNSNVWIARDEENRSALIIADRLTRSPNEYLAFSYMFKSKIRSENGNELFNCHVFTLMDENLNLAFYLSVVRRLEESKELSEKYELTDFENALKECSDLAKASQMNLEQIIGFWGELFFVKTVLEKNITSLNKLQFLRGWQDESLPTVHDFRYPPSFNVFEVKTTILNTREHSFGSLAQVQAPDGYKGFCVSIHIEKVSVGGLSCVDLMKEIKENLGSEHTSVIFEQRCEIAFGKKISINSLLEYQFSTRVNGMRFYRFEDIPKPISASNVLRIEWSSKFIDENGEFDKWSVFDVESTQG